jgi:hypothetical protein
MFRTKVITLSVEGHELYCMRLESDNPILEELLKDRWMTPKPWASDKPEIISKYNIERYQELYSVI